MIIDTKIAPAVAKRPTAGKVTLFVNEANELKIKLADNTVTSPFSDVIVSVTTVYNGLPAAANPSTAVPLVYVVSKSLTFTFSLTGTGTITTTVDVEVSLDGTTWITPANDNNLRINLAGTAGTAVETLILNSAWRFVRIRTSNVAGTITNLTVQSAS